MWVTRTVRLLSWAVAGVLSISHVTLQTSAQNPPAAQPGSSPDRVRVQMHNVLYRFTDRIAARIYQLEGAIVPTKEATIPVFDDKRSFAVDIAHAEISVSTSALTNAMNQFVFAASDAPLKDLSITTNGSTLTVKGKLHSKGDVPFETEGTVEATSEGQIRIRAHKIRAAHLPMKGLMDLLGVKIADLINTRKVAGVQSEENDLLLDPQQIFPPPLIKGKVTRVEIRGDQIVQIYGTPPKHQSAPPVQGNYMVYRGGKLTFGKLTMTDTDLILIDQDPRDPFDFSLDHYNDQLVAGYTKNTPEHGLRVFMPDYSKLRRKQPASASPPGASSSKGSGSD